MRKFPAWLTGAILIGNALFMLAMPLAWYRAIPGVCLTGSFNAHFIRDIGCIYLTAGGAFVLLPSFPELKPAAFGGAVFLVLHALVHVWDLLAGREVLSQLAGDLPGVFLLPILAMGAAIAAPTQGAIE